MYLNENKLVAIEKIIENPEKVNSWNNFHIKWIVQYNEEKNSKVYQICLEIVKLSSKRQVSVNGQIKCSALVSFGFDCQFVICNGLIANIKQTGLNFNFQLYLNGKSFTELESNQPKYQAIKQSTLPYQKEKLSRKQEKIISAVTSKKTEEIVIKPEKDAKKKEINVQQNTTSNVSQEQKIKETQKQLMKILKASKNSKKENVNGFNNGETQKTAQIL